MKLFVIIWRSKVLWILFWFKLSYDWAVLFCWLLGQKQFANNSPLVHIAVPTFLLGSKTVLKSIAAFQSNKESAFNAVYCRAKLWIKANFNTETIMETVLCPTCTDPKYVINKYFQKAGIQPLEWGPRNFLTLFVLWKLRYWTKSSVMKNLTSLKGYRDYRKGQINFVLS